MLRFFQKQVVFQIGVSPLNAKCWGGVNAYLLPSAAFPYQFLCMSSDERVGDLAKHGIGFFPIRGILVVEPHLVQTGAEMGTEIFDDIESALEVLGGRR